MENLFGKPAPSPLDEVQAIRGLNADYAELGCDASPASVPCANLRAAMQRLGLGAAPPKPPAVALRPPAVAAAPPTLVSKSAADAAHRCTRRCGLLGTVLAAGLPALLPEEELGGESQARAVAAGASLGFVALCSRVCENRSPGVAQPGVPYKLVGTYTHEVPDLAAVEAFASGLKSVGK